MLFCENNIDIRMPLLQKSQQRFVEFLKFLSMSVSSEAWTIGYNDNNFNYIPKWRGHHKGALIRILSEGPRLTTESIHKFQNDPYHGILHGIMVAFIAFCYKYPDRLPDSIFDELYTPNNLTARIHTPITENERLLASCLLHDFGRTTEDQNHDNNLKDLFPNLCSETYFHCDPNETQENHPLIVGDRWELKRYSDFNNWIKEGTFDNFPPSLIPTINCFYNYVRPAINYIFEYQNEIWIRHSPEGYRDMEDFNAYQNIHSNDPYPPLKGHWQCRADVTGYWACEYGTLPFKGNVLFQTLIGPPFGVIPFKRLKHYGNEYSLGMDNTVSVVIRDRDRPAVIEGLEPPIPKPLIGNWKEEYKTTGLSRQNFMSREHPCIRAEIPLKEWVFLYHANQKMSKEHENLVFNSNGIVDVKLINSLFETAKHIITLITLLRT